MLIFFSPVTWCSQFWKYETFFSVRHILQRRFLTVSTHKRYKLEELSAKKNKIIFERFGDISHAMFVCMFYRKVEARMFIIRINCCRADAGIPGYPRQVSEQTEKEDSHIQGGF